MALEALKDFAAAKRAEKGLPFDLAANVVTSERGERLSPNSVGEKYVACRRIAAGRSGIGWSRFVIDRSEIRAG